MPVYIAQEESVLDPPAFAITTLFSVFPNQYLVSITLYVLEVKEVGKVTVLLVFPAEADPN